MDWYSLHIKNNDAVVKDFLTSYAFDIGCTGVEDMEESYFLDDPSSRKEGLKIYFPGDHDVHEMIALLKKALLDFSPAEELNETEIVIEEIIKQNWREEWKKDYRPIEAKEFMVVPSWLDADFPGKIKILIEPKMAFGTGTHETTRMMLDLISGIECKGKKVMDAGTGSGILAIGTAKKGAVEIFGNDVEEESIDNSRENWELNGLNNDLATFELVGNHTYAKENYYDLVLANIHRTVLEVLLPELVKVAKPGALILLSGILVDEKHIMLSRIAEIAGIKLDKEIAFNEWCSLQLIKG